MAGNRDEDLLCVDIRIAGRGGTQSLHEASVDLIQVHIKLPEPVEIPVGCLASLADQ